MILICGIPNAGKTTYSQKFSNAIHYDEMNGTIKDRCALLNELAKNNGSVFEGVFGEAKMRKELVSNSKGNAVCIWIDTPIDVCIEREKNYRRRSLGMVEMHHNNFETPTLDEGWDEIIIIRGNNEQRISKQG